ncbi:MAG: DUF4091 domain-containing protein [Armatimonadetes bacterium]|nr:DUF4091 domain-containing protein [Armatimonadota bacterium]
MWHCVVIVALVVLAVGSAAFAAEPRAWFEPSVQKVFPTDTGRSTILGALCVDAARNEYESFQIVVRAGDRPLEDVRVTVEVGAAHDGASATAPDIPVRLYLPHYVPCPNHNRDFPDPLPPLTEPFRVEANTSRPVWVELYIPPDTRAAAYPLKCYVQTDRHGGLLYLPLDLCVADFVLPMDVEPVTTFGLSEGFVFGQHGVEAGTAEAQALRQAYYEFLLEHYVSAYYLPVDLKSPQAAKYLNDPRLTSYVIPWKEDEAYLRDIATYLDERGRLDKGYLYVVDEPINRDSYDRIQAAAELIHRAHPGLRLTAPFFRAPDWDDRLTTFDVLTGSLDIWCPNEHYFDQNPRAYEQFRERQAAGETGWWYVCCGPGAPYNNFFVDMDGFAHRLIFTQMYRLGVTGLLYWTTTYWNPAVGTKDPWTDMATVKDINPAIYGDGSLLYPGKPVGIDGPVGSIRLKLIREGIEDYQYLRLLAEARGEEAALRAARALCKSLTEYCHDAEQLERVRTKVAREIVEGR